MDLLKDNLAAKCRIDRAEGMRDTKLARYIERQDERHNEGGEDQPRAEPERSGQTAAIGSWAGGATDQAAAMEDEMINPGQYPRAAGKPQRWVRQTRRQERITT